MKTAQPPFSCAPWRLRKWDAPTARIRNGWPTSLLKRKAEADLVGAAILALAADDLAAGRDPRPRLEDMPEQSDHAARALHLVALSSLAEGDTAAAAKVLRDAGNRPSRIRRIGAWRCWNPARWLEPWATGKPALDRYEAAESDLEREQRELETLREPEVRKPPGIPGKTGRTGGRKSVWILPPPAAPWMKPC